MARVEFPPPADLTQDSLGNVLSGRSVTAKLAGTATNVTHYSALTGGTSTTGGLFTYTDGTIVDGSNNRRYVDSGITMDITIAGRTRQVEAVSGTDVAVLKEAPLNMKDSRIGAVGDSATNDSAAFTTAKGMLPAVGGELYFPPSSGKYLINAETMDFDGLRALTLHGGGGPSSAGVQPASCIHIRNNGTWGMRVRSTFGFQWRDLALTYESGTFTGELVQVKQGTAGFDPQFTRFENFAFGDGIATSATLLINLEKAVNVTFDGEWTMHGALRLVKGTTASVGSYSTQIRFNGGRFASSKIAPVLNPGLSWVFNGTTFQQLLGGTADPVTGLTPAANAAGGILAETGVPACSVVLLGVGFYDSVLASGGKWVDLSRVPISIGFGTLNSFVALGGEVGSGDDGFYLGTSMPVVVAGQLWGGYNNKRVTYNASGRNFVLAGDTAGDSLSLDGVINLKGASAQLVTARLQDNALNTILAFANSGDAQDRFRLLAGGRMEFGGGAGARDVTVDRFAANQFGALTADICARSAGRGFRVGEGSNAKQGVATLVGGTVTVANTSVTANSRIFLTSNTDGGTPGFVRVSARVNGTSFTITSSSGTDTSTIAYEIFEPSG